MSESGRSNAAKPERPRLNRERVIAAAVEFADREGLAAVSMRKLADELGVVPMALYKHVADKEALIDGMVDAVIDEYDVDAFDLGAFDVAASGDDASRVASADGPAGPAVAVAPPREPTWRDRVRACILAARRALGRHPWAHEAIETRTHRTPAVLGHQDRIAGMFMAAGFSADLTHHVMHVLGNRIWGFSPELFTGRTPREAAAGADAAAREAEAAGPAADEAAARRLAEFVERYPHITAIARSTARDDDATPAGCDEEFEFDFALDLLLDAFERLHEREWSSRS